MSSTLFDDIFAPPAPDESRRARRTQVLIAAAQPLLRAQLTSLLGSHSFEVSACATGQEALDAFVAHAFDLVIADGALPGSPVSGRALLEQIKAVGTVPVILMNGEPDPSELDLDPASLPDRMLAKPFRPADFRRAVADCLKARRTPTEVPAEATTPARRFSELVQVRLEADAAGAPGSSEAALRALPRQELLIESGPGTFETLCTAGQPLPVAKIQACLRLGMRLWTPKKQASRKQRAA